MPDYPALNNEYLNNLELKKVVSRLDALLTLPAVASKILKVCTEEDPGLATKFLAWS